MAIEFLDWSGVQKLWTKIKNTFVAKDSSGNVSVTGNATATGLVTAKGGVIAQGTIELHEGSPLEFHSEDGTKQKAMWCNDDGNIVIASKVIATVDDVTTAVANAGHLKREKVSTLPGVATAKENVIYMVSNSTTGNNKFDEYMLIDGAWEKTGSSDIDLSGYPTTEQMNTAISNAHTAITEAQINSLS